MQRIYINNLGRRSFLKAAGTATGMTFLSGAVSLPLMDQFGNHREEIPSITDASIHAMVSRGVDAARAAGAQYSEVRLTNGLVRDIEPKRVYDFQTIHASVRAFVNGQWGFATGSLWEDEAIVELARRATMQAKEAAVVMKGQGFDIDLLPKVDIVRNEHWHMPVKTDPLSVHPYVIQDFFHGLISKSEDEFGPDNRIEKVDIKISARFFVQERAFGTSDDWYGTQRTYLTSGSLGIWFNNGRSRGMRVSNLVSPAGLGWEHFTDQPLGEIIVKALHDIKTDMSLPSTPITPGKYAIMLDAATTARLVSYTIGTASELDRALGYEANTSGISFLNSPARMLDKLMIGSPLLNVTANRSDSGGAATVKWDDEGVAPRPFTIVEDGVFHNYHLSREGVSWLQKENIGGRDKPQGIVSAIRGQDKPYIRTANLEMAPSVTPGNEEELISQMQNGIVFEDANTNMDSSMLNGMVGGGRAYEIKRGKKVARIAGAAVIINTPELWKSLNQLGGSNSKVRIGISTQKGDPVQQAFHSVTSVPAVFKDQTLTDINLR